MMRSSALFRNRWQPSLENLESRELLSAAGASTDQVLGNYGRVPLSFEANQGQTDAQVKFLSRGAGYALFLTPTQAVLSLNQGQHSNAEVLSMSLLGANPAPQVTGLDPQTAASNYFIGNDPSRWRTDVVNCGRVQYQNVYPGIDLIYYGNQRQLEYDFRLAAGADPSAIRLKFQGAQSLELDGQGQLVLHTATGDVIEHAPVLYQETAAGRRAVAGHYVLQGGGQVGFQVGPYDHAVPLVIDPVLAYSTYLGGSGTDTAVGVAVDANGNAYVTGSTTSANFPTRNPFQATKGNARDVFITKLAPSGTALVYSTFLGGSGNDGGNAIAIDAAGNVYVTGATSSPNFPTQNPFQPFYGGGDSDVFVTELNAAGNALVFSTYLGGAAQEFGIGIGLAPDRSVIVAGTTFSSNYPLRSPLQAVFGGRSDAFVTELAPGGMSLVYSTFLGGGDYDYGQGLAVDSAGDAYVAGYTYSTNFPTRNALQPANAGDVDTFVTEVNASGTALVYSTYLGGSANDLGSAVAVDGTGNAYVVGYTGSSNYPLRNAFQSSKGEFETGFVTKVNAGGASLAYSTFLGGRYINDAYSVAVDAAGHAYVTGQTLSTDFPLQDAFQPRNAGGTDAFVTEFAVAGNAVVYSTYLGGGANDVGYGIAVDAAGSAYVVGDTLSSNFPVSTPFEGYSGGDDAFVTKIRGDLSGTASHLGVSAPISATAGSSVSVTVTALDATNMLATGYLGTVHFTSTDSNAMLPADYTFVPADRGVHTFFVSLRTAGSQTVTATDTQTASVTGSTTITVVPADPAGFVVSGYPSPTVAGSVNAFFVTVVDRYGNTVTGYTGTVHLTSSDPQALLSRDYTFTAADHGTHALAAVLATAGSQTLTATDTRSGITGSQNGILVTPAPAVQLLISLPATATSGQPFDVTVTAVDPYGNVDVNYQGTVTFSTSDPDPGVVLPPDYTFQPGDQGMATFASGVTLITLGDQTVTATDTSSGISGTGVVTVTAGPTGRAGLRPIAVVGAIGTPAPAAVEVRPDAGRPTSGAAAHPMVEERVGSRVLEEWPWMTRRRRGDAAGVRDEVWLEAVRGLLEGGLGLFED